MLKNIKASCSPQLMEIVLGTLLHKKPLKNNILINRGHYLQIMLTLLFRSTLFDIEKTSQTIFKKSSCP